MDPNNKPIGVFDSGVGGLSVLRAIRKLMPEEPAIYIADQANVPYGSRSLEQVRGLSVAISQFLIEQQVKLVVVACNTASAAALHYLREFFPKIPFVGMEPAVKPAAEHTRSGLVGVLATPATFQGALYASVLERFASGVQVLQDTCPGLVGQIENGDFNGQHTREILKRALFPMLDKGIDTIVLGCTHYPYVIPLIQELVGNEVRVIDPAPAVARQARRLLELHSLKLPPGKVAALRFFTSGIANEFIKNLPLFLGETGPVETILWNSDKVVIESQAGLQT
jgi:glutamate racemase